MENKEPYNHFLSLIEETFSRRFHYLLRQKTGQEITDFFRETLYMPFLSGHKKTMWGSFSKTLPKIGRKIGWVPDGIPLIFFNQTVHSEIAESSSISRGQIQAADADFQFATELLTLFELADIAYRNPFFLSGGETKIVWFITQWAKRPAFLFISSSGQSLSRYRTNQLLHFLKESDSLAEYFGFHGPTIVLGITQSESDQYQDLLSNNKWLVRDAKILNDLCSAGK